MDQLKPSIPALEKGEVWANRELLPDMPMYVAAAKEDGKLVLEDPEYCASVSFTVGSWIEMLTKYSGK